MVSKRKRLFSLVHKALVIENTPSGGGGDVPLSYEAGVVVSARRNSARYGEDVGQWLNATYPGGGLDVEGQLHGLLCRRI
jgi:hypothetical protein